MEEFDASDQGAPDNWPERFFAYLVDGSLTARKLIELAQPTEA